MSYTNDHMADHAGMTTSEAEPDWMPQEGVDYSDAEIYESMQPGERKALHDEVGRVLAKQVGAALIGQMIADRDLTLASIQKDYGFASKVLSQLVNARSKDGPNLATIYAIADALDFDVEIELVDRTAE